MKAVIQLIIGSFLWAGIGLRAADWHVTTNGAANGNGTKDSPWDLITALKARRNIHPGDTVWIAGGLYKHPNRKGAAMGFEVGLAGTPEKPVIVRGVSGQRVTVDGGITVQPPSTCLWMRDLEIMVSENIGASRRFDEPGSHPQSYNRPWGGLNVYSGSDCKFINLIIHDNGQGVSWWTASSNSELHGCIIFDNGWDAPDRGHGHAIYTQNDQGVKTISDCIMTRGHGYTLHAYGSSRADVNNYLAVGNICYDGGPFLVGSGKPSHHIRILTNVFFGVPVRLGYNAPTNEDCEVFGNVIVNAALSINKYRKVDEAGNLLVANNTARPAGVRVILRPNRHDPHRANVAVFNWEKRPTVELDPQNVLRRGQRFRLLNPTDFFGEPAVSGTFDGKPIQIPSDGEFAAYILIGE